jgi:CRISPR system Cascade subunit CasD
MAAHGETGAARVRNSWSRPARSAVLGLVAGALGITHEDDASHAALSSCYGFAVRTDAVGRSLRDYHTTHHPEGKAARNLRTRRAELEWHDVGCIPTSREYRTDALYTVALWARPGARWPLDDLAAALRHPVFVPYLGRKACALSLPMLPEIIEAGSLPDALALRPALPLAVAELMPIRLVDHPELACDADAVGVSASLITTRRDGYRGRRIFAERAEHIANLTRMP